MGDDNEDCWETYIAASPDEDAGFAGCGPAAGSIALLAMVGGLVVWLMAR